LATRGLDLPDASVDAVLLLGPLYHLVSRAERTAAIREAARILRPGGPLFAAAISRWATRIDGIIGKRIYLEYPAALDLIDEVERTGNLPPLHASAFTAYTHRPDDLRAELTEAGFQVADLVSVEGPGLILPDLDARMTDPADRAAILDAARSLERVPELIGFGPHLLATAIRPATG
jgi:SAM-dependent methyltransferase